MASKYEYKYLVPDKWLDEIRAEISPFVESDRHAVRQNPREYTVRSIYLDTPGLACYHEKLEGIKVRRKFRIRGYDELTPESTTFLEIKRKNVNLVSKTRTQVEWRNLSVLLDSRSPISYFKVYTVSGAHGDSVRSFLYYLKRSGLIPTVLVVYDREAFHGRFDPTIRVTFDKNLRSAARPNLDALYQEEYIHPVFRDHFVLEVKFFRGLPLWIRSVIERYQLSRKAVSKYAICLRSHGPVRRLVPGLERSLPTPDAVTGESERIPA